MSGDSSEDSYTVVSIFNTARLKKTMMKVKLSGTTYRHKELLRGEWVLVSYDNVKCSGEIKSMK